MKKIASLFFAAVLALALVACGGDASSEVTASTAEGEGTVAAPMTPDDIKAEGTLVMMTNATFPPYEYVRNNADNAFIVNGITGVDIEICKLIADELGVELDILDMSFGTLISGLNSGKGHVIAAAMSITDERLEEVDFSVPYVDTTLSVVVPVDSDLGVGDLDGLVISVQESTTSDLFVSDDENLEPGDILRYKSAVDAGNAVRTNKADALVVDELTAQSIVNNSDGTLKMLDEAIGHEQYALAVPKGSDALLEVINSVLEKAVADGTVEELITKHMDIAKEG